MLRLKFTLSFILIFCFGANCVSQIKPEADAVLNPVKQGTVLSIVLSGHNAFYFNAPGDPLKFNNYTSDDSALAKILMIDKPTHLFYSIMYVKDINDKSKDVTERGDMIVLPGDSIILDHNGHSIAYSTGFQKYIDSLIIISELSNPKLSFSTRVSEAKRIYDKNEKAISELSMDANQKSILKNFNYFMKAYQISGFRFEKGSYKKPVLDSFYNDMLSHIAIIESINSIYTGIIYDNIIRYSAFKKGISSQDFWSYFNKVDSNILFSSFYEPYLLSCIKGSYRNRFDAMPGIAAKLKRIKNPSKFVDTLSTLTTILLKTKTDCAGAKKELDQYANGRYSSIMEETDVLHHQQRKIQSLPSTMLADYNSKEYSLQKVIFSGNTNITVLDFWASWCVPCVADYPYLKKAEDNLKGKSIQFISISIDKATDADKWVNRMKQLKTYKNPDQYRLIYTKDPPIKEFFDMATIPRYIVIDKNGKILSEQFNRPDESSFQRKLEAYLREY